MKLPARSRLFALLCAAFLSLAHAEDEQVTLNFVNSDVESAIKAVGVITGKNFVIDPKVKGTINIVSNQPVARDLVYPILLSALRQQGFTAVDNGSIIKVMPEADAKAQSVQVLGRQGKSSGDRLVTKVYPLAHESATLLANTLRPLISPSNQIAAYQGNNTLVITDYADNVARISRIIDSIDQPPLNEVFSLPIKHASALDIAQTIARLMPEVLVQGIAAPTPVAEGVRRTVVVADLRGNQLLVRSEAAPHAKQIKALVTSLDTPAASGSNINVVYLRNAEAVRLATTLKGILTGQDSTAAASTAPSPAPATTAANSSSFTAANAASASPAPAVQGASVNVQLGGATVLIQADAMTNSLIITAPDHIYNNLRSVIDKLDMRRAQIFIEALIAEVNVGKSGELGVQWVAGGGDGSLAAGLLSSLSPNATNLGSLYTNYKADKLAVPTTFSVGVGGSSWGMLITAIEKNGNGNILSAPNLLMLDNEEARIVVGQNIPILTGSYTTTSGSSTNPFQTVERKDVGIMLKIKPQISDSGSITLKVAQEVSSVDNSVNTDGAGLATKIRQIDTKVLINDGQTIVLGGLIEDKVTESKIKVPLLGDIPYLGSMFRYETQDHAKVNLMVFLRPTILRDAASSQTLSSERYEYLRAEQGRYAAQVGGSAPTVQLPPLATAPNPDSGVDVRSVPDNRQP